MRTVLLLTTLVTLAACRNKNEDDPKSGSDGTDLLEDIDADGYTSDEDCDDEDASVNPGVDELCDGIDNNCDGEIDEGVLSVFYLDNDGDGFGADASATEACVAPADYVTESGDCDDFSDQTYPDAAERCDSIDNDCDDEIDEEVLDVWYADADGDGFGNPDQTLDSCDPPGGFVADNTDCDDLEAASFPDNPEVCDEVDNDCDGEVDEEVLLTFYTDADADGYGVEDQPVEACELPAGASAIFGDCDDTSNAVSPAAVEVCDTIDNDCDGAADEADAADALVWYADTDGDGYGDPAASQTACEAPPAAVDNADDCDDTAVAVNPGATEVCDSIDNDCDGVTDRVDDDADGYLAQACGGGDCDDTNSAINPAAAEVFYDGIDQDCDSASDFDADGDGFDSVDYSGTDCDDATASTYPGATDAFYDGVDANCDEASDFDADGDGFDSDQYGGDDCNDANASINPSATELINGIDENCDGISDYDEDADGYVAEAFGGTDCDDADPTVNPGATEVWYNGIDENCDGNDDDQDGDGFSSTAVTGGDDCDDGAPAVNPGATEVCEDGIDNDCDGYANGCGPYGENAAIDADAIIRGAAAGDRLAQGDPGFDAAGDLNGDGVDDLIIGALRESTVANRAGAAYVFYGPLSGTVSASSADATLLGESESDLAGRSVAGVGDVNGDGADDLWVGAIFEDSGASNGGAAYLVLGPVSGTASLGTADAKWTGVGANDYAAEVAVAGDLNNDGLPDLLVGAQFGDESGSNAGTAYLVFGPGTAGGSFANADVVITGEAAADEASTSLWGAGDVNGDGVDDMIIGARYNDSAFTDAGAAYVLLGPVTADLDLSSADVKWTGEEADAQIGFGVSMSGAGDQNGDGIDDLIIGARNDNTADVLAGGAYVVNGSSALGVTVTSGSLSGANAKLLGEVTRDYTGDSVHGPGDVNGDGFDDLLVGSGYNDDGATNGGALYVVNGPVTGVQDLADADGIVRAEGAEDRARVHGVGDLDNDGQADVMMGSMLNDAAGADAGAAYLFYGSGL